MKQMNQNFPIMFAYDGPLKGGSWKIEKELIIGRGTDCNIIIPDRQVSRFHAKLEVNDGGQIRIVDLGSKNGTYVNGERINGSAVLVDGDAIKIALIQELVFVSSDATLPLDIELDKPTSKNKVLYIDEKARRIWIGEKELIPPLSVPQYKLLTLLYQSENIVVPREKIVQAVWGEDESIGVTEQALDALVRRLRKRLLKNDPTHAYIVTVRGVGLIFKNDSYDV
ncbi:MAG: FHA domain-containing protein [Anaerolineaceae bacterium]|nr:FHA domain-containing protein [Anaerolineaceae bacterium]